VRRTPNIRGCGLLVTKILISLLSLLCLRPLCLSGEKPSLEARLAPLVKAHKGRVTVVVKHLITGETFVLGGDEVMPTASLIKFPLMVEVYMLVHEGKLKLSDMVTLREKDKVPGSGILTYHFSEGATFPLRDAVRLMIAYSDNTATNLILDKIGIEAMNKRMDAWGYPHTRINAKVFLGKTTSVSPERTKRYGLGSTTANETVKLLEQVYLGKAVSPEACKEMLEHLKKCEDKGSFPRLLPAGTVVAHKTGSVTGVRTDAGILYLKSGPVALCVLTEKNEDKTAGKDNAGNVLCARVARAVYDHYAEARKDPPKTTKLGVDGTAFTINGKATFLLGISYYAGLGASDQILQKDLDEIQKHGFNWIRIWATWAAFDHDISAVDAKGNARPEQLKKLVELVRACDQRGLIVDVSLSRGNGVTGPPRLQSLAAHRRAVETIVQTLKPYGNWYLDLSNERNIKDKRFTSFADLKELRRRVTELDPKRLVTASHAGDISKDELKEYLGTVGVDFIAPHRPRNAKSPMQTEAKSREYLEWIRAEGRVVPLHYQEPFRRGFGKYQPSAADFLVDLDGAKKGGAAGWCFHNGDERAQADGKPRRSFDLRQARLFEQLDAEERKLLQTLRH